jgi:diguanylate cyclase (GGDEF)-like protein
LSLALLTIVAYTGCILALISVILGVLWASEEQRDRRLPWFLFPLGTGACGTALLAVPSILPGRLPLQLGTWLILLAYGLGWQAMRALCGRPQVLILVVIPPSLWLVLAVGAFDPYHLTGLNALARSLIVVCFQGLAAHELWKVRDERLPAGVALFWTFTGYAVYTAIKLPFVDDLPMPLGALPTSVWAVIVYNAAAVTLVLLAGSFMIALSRERVALRHYQMAMLDPLTGVGNRRAFGDAGARRASSGDLGSTVLMVIDIDHFKSVNDRFGHNIGDEVIKLAARTAVEAVRNHESVFRMGGEEFACLLPSVQPDEAYFLAERLRAMFGKHATEVAGHAVNATLSIGIAASAGNREELATILGRADEALYRAKRNGRNQSVMAERASDLRGARRNPGLSDATARRS